MHSKLVEIITEKEREVQELKKKTAPLSQIPDLPSRRDFKKAINHPGKISLIAEIKFASPSAGNIREMQDPLMIGRRQRA
jgi:indole-3-glycerol phosphate synthase